MGKVHALAINRREAVPLPTLCTAHAWMTNLTIFHLFSFSLKVIELSGIDDCDDHQDGYMLIIIDVITLKMMMFNCSHN